MHLQSLATCEDDALSRDARAALAKGLFRSLGMWASSATATKLWAAVHATGLQPASISKGIRECMLSLVEHTERVQLCAVYFRMLSSSGCEVRHHSV